MKVCPIFSPEDADLARMAWRTASRGRGYARSTFNRKPLYPLVRLAHHLVAERMGLWPAASGLEIDHINRNTLDNRRNNLRLVTRAVNNENRSYSPTRGTTWNKAARKWQAFVKRDGKAYYLGCFVNREQAVRVAFEKRKELQMHQPTP